MTHLQSQATQGQLRREINLAALIAIMIGMNVGGSLFALTAIAAGLTGPSLFITQIISAAPILLALIPYLTLSSAIPTTCASYQYAKLFSHPAAVAAWMTLFVAIPIGALPLFAVVTANFLKMLIPTTPVILTAIGVMTLFYLLNVFGIKRTAYVQLGTVIILLLALFTFIVPGIPAIETVNMTPLFTGGVMGFLGASALLFTLLAGGLFGIDIGGEVKSARLMIPKALVISVIVVIVLYLLIEVVAVGVVNWQSFAAGESLGIPAKVFLSGPLLGFFIIGGGILACITTINLILTLAGRYALAFAQDGFFPRVFGKINRRFGTPHWGLTLAYGMSVITLLINPPLIVLGQMINFGLLFMITLVLFAAYRLPKKHPEIYAKSKFRFSPRILAITSLSAISINIIFMVVLVYALMTSENAKWTFPLFIIAAVAGLIVYFVRKRQLGFIPKGFELDQEA
jgi:APA family basic amino acid/polyamine antiporter